MGTNDGTIIKIAVIKCEKHVVLIAEVGFRDRCEGVRDMRVRRFEGEVLVSSAYNVIEPIARDCFRERLQSGLYVYVLSDQGSVLMSVRDSRREGSRTSNFRIKSIAAVGNLSPKGGLRRGGCGQYTPRRQTYIQARS